MTRALPGLVFGSLFALTACSSDQPSQLDSSPPPVGLAVGAQLFPSTPSVTEYTTWSTTEGAAAPRRSEDLDVSLAYAGKKPLQPKIEIDVGYRTSKDLDRVTLAAGKPSIRPDLPPGAVDLLELLPPANAHLRVGEAYESPAPDDEYIREMAAKGKLVLWQQLTQTPTAVLEMADVTLVRVEGTATNRLHFVDDDGAIKSVALGAAYLSVADLVMVPGEGWQILRFARLTEIEGAEDDPLIDLARARTRNHSTFTVCASRMDVVGSSLPRLHASLVADVPEFAACLTK